MPSDRGNVEAEVRIGWRMGAMAMEIAAQVVGGFLLGWGFDLWRGHGQTGRIVGAIAGIVVALYTFIRGALKLNRQLDRVSPTTGRGRPLPPDPEPDDWPNGDDDQRPEHETGERGRG